MSDYNKVGVSGRLGSDLEIRHTPKGTAVADVNIAVQDGFGDNERTLWLGLVFWGKSAEAAAKYLGKGRKVLVEGRLNQDEWEDKKTGQKRTKTRVTVENWYFMDGKTGEQSDAPQARTEPRKPQEPLTTRNVHEREGVGAGTPQPDDAENEEIPF